MLYERWRSVAAQQRDEIALSEPVSGRQWTFSDLFTMGEAIQVGSNDFVFPRGHSAEFILAVLAAWRTGKVVCPLEMEQAPPQIPNPPAPCVHLKVTSATTGKARLVAFTAEQIAADAENIVTAMGLRPDWPNLGVISLAHSYGFSNLVTPLLLHGIPLTLSPSSLPEVVRRAAEGESALTLPAVPALWRAWHNADAIPPQVKLAVSAGAPLPLALEQEVFTQRGLKIHNFYGASECGGIAYDVSNSLRTDAACVGAPVKNISLSVTGDGCMEVHSQAVGEMYWPEPSPALSGGRFLTSDVAELKDGLVFLRGRAGDLINVAGRKVSPDTIEQVLLRHPAVRECLVFGVPSRGAERADEIVAAVVTQADEESLRRFAQESLPAWQAPRHWWPVKAVGANERGKVSRAEWRERWQASQ